MARTGQRLKPPPGNNRPIANDTDRAFSNFDVTSGDRNIDPTDPRQQLESSSGSRAQSVVRGHQQKQKGRTCDEREKKEVIERYRPYSSTDSHDPLMDGQTDGRKSGLMNRWTYERTDN